MKKQKSDLLELQNLYIELNHSRQPRKDRILKAIEKAKNRIPEHLAQRVEDFHEKGRVAMVAMVNGACSGCYLTLPGGVINSLIAQNNNFVCENCGCFVYAGQESPSTARTLSI
jgi:predicted  nucleic acid-binding Zn-ribbon protein